MTWQDLITGLFEACGGWLVFLNVYQTWKDKQVKGVHIASNIFFTSWGVWNLYYWPHLDQWLAFSGGIPLAVANACWLAQVWYYGRKQGLASPPTP